MTADLMHDPAMTGLCMSLLGALRSALRTRAELALDTFRTESWTVVVTAWRTR